MQIVVGRFSDRTDAFQLGERLQRPLLRGQFDRLAIHSFALATDAGQLAGLKIGMLRQNSQRINTHHRCVLAGVARKHNASVTREVKQPLHVVNTNRPSFVQHHQSPDPISVSIHRLAFYRN
jgi:hypothetical protein